MAPLHLCCMSVSGFMMHVEMRVNRCSRVSYIQYSMTACPAAYWAAEHAESRQGMIITLARFRWVGASAYPSKLSLFWRQAR